MTICRYLYADKLNETCNTHIQFRPLSSKFPVCSKCRVLWTAGLCSLTVCEDVLILYYHSNISLGHSPLSYMCMYVCRPMYAMCVRTCTQGYVCICVFMYVWMYVCRHAYVCMCEYMYSYMYLYLPVMYVYMHVCCLYAC
jgi:hypothetical protein